MRAGRFCDLEYRKNIFQPPIRIIGLFFILTKLDIPACLAFFLMTDSPMNFLMSSSDTFGFRRWSLRFISVLPKRQTFKFPSAVNLRRLQVPQKLSLIEVMKPTLPTKPGTFQALEVSFEASISEYLKQRSKLMISFFNS